MSFGYRHPPTRGRGLIPPSGGLTLLREADVEGRIELIDPETCSILDSAHTLAGSYVIVVTPADPPNLDLHSEFYPSDSPAATPDFPRCESSSQPRPSSPPQP
jgi:hypothetical protein